MSAESTPRKDRPGTCQRHGRVDCQVCFEEAVGVRGPQEFPWRTGRKVGRTIYMCRYEPGDLIGGRSSGIVIASNSDLLIGVMDTPEIATEAVNAHNAQIGFGQNTQLRSSDVLEVDSSTESTDTPNSRKAE